MAARSKAARFLGLRVRISLGEWMFVVSVVCYQISSLRRTDHSSRGILTNVVCLSVIMKPRHLEDPGPLGAVSPWNKKTWVNVTFILLATQLDYPLISLLVYHHHHHHHHISVTDLGHLLTRSGLTYPQVSSKVYHDSFCQLGRSITLSWVIYFDAFYLNVVSSFSCIPAICAKLVLFLTPL